MEYVRARLLKLGSLLICALLVQSAAGQDQVTVTAPFQSMSDSFSENFGIGFGFSGPGFFFNNGGATSALAPFGPPPTGGATFGGGGRLGNARFGWNAIASQGSSRTMVMEAPTLTMMNGSGGFFFSGSMRPFVMGFVPVVAANSISPIELRLQQLSEHGGLEQSILERRKQRLEEERRIDEQYQNLPPLQKEDDPPLILQGGKEE